MKVIQNNRVFTCHYLLKLSSIFTTSFTSTLPAAGCDGFPSTTPFLAFKYGRIFAAKVRTTVARSHSQTESWLLKMSDYFVPLIISLEYFKHMKLNFLRSQCKVIGSARS